MKTRLVGFRMEEEKYQLLERIAVEWEVPVSQLVRDAVNAYLISHATENGIKPMSKTYEDAILASKFITVLIRLMNEKYKPGEQEEVGALYQKVMRDWENLIKAKGPEQDEGGE